MTLLRTVGALGGTVYATAAMIAGLRHDMTLTAFLALGAATTIAVSDLLDQVSRK